MDKKLLKTIESILKNKAMTGEYEYKGNMEHCYTSAYQLAVLLDKNYRQLLDNLNYPSKIGGRGLGEHNSLAMRIARDLSAEIDHNLKSDIEIAFFCTNGLEKFSFRDEKDILREPSGNCFSMFRCKNL